jgi:acyl carrier protein
MSVNRVEIIERLTTIIADQLSKDVEKIRNIVAIQPDAELELLGIDELEHFELMMNIEEAFECEISDQEAEGLLHFGELVDFVIECREKNP